MPQENKERRSGHGRTRPERHREKTGVSEPRREVPGETSPPDTFISDVLPPELAEINLSCLSHRVCGVLLQTPRKLTQRMIPKATKLLFHQLPG